ncbi:MAG: patatin [Myxococcales bacterium]|jgi:NTE family protein|nr:patatin [Myxococcales bacterium]
MAPLAEQLAGKRVALAMSSGFFGFYHHGGVLRALCEVGIRPCALSGTSAGSIVAGLHAAGLDPDQIQTEMGRIRRADFWDMQFPFSRHGTGLIAGGRFGALLSRILPVHRFEDCPIPVYLGVYRIRDGRTLTLDSGSLIEAIRASCAVPYMFAPVLIDGEAYLDGGLAEKTPLAPFIDAPDIDAVLVSRLPPREDTGGKARKSGLFSGLSFGLDTPLEERIERDRRAVALLRERGKRVHVLAPSRIWLGPFSLHKATEAAEHAYRATMTLLTSPDAKLGCPDLA